MGQIQFRNSVVTLLSGGVTTRPSTSTSRWSSSSAGATASSSSLWSPTASVSSLHHHQSRQGGDVCPDISLATPCLQTISGDCSSSERRGDKAEEGRSQGFLWDLVCQAAAPGELRDWFTRKGEIGQPKTPAGLNIPGWTVNVDTRSFQINQAEISNLLDQKSWRVFTAEKICSRT